MTRLISSFLVLLALFAFQSNSYSSEPLKQNKAPTIVVQSENLSPQQIGLEIGSQSKRLFPNIEALYDRHLSTVLHQNQFKNILKNKLPYLLDKIDKTYLEEMNGVVASWVIAQNSVLGDGFLSKDEYLLLNLLPDTVYAPNGAGFGVYAKAAKDEQTIVGRNLDWKNTPELRRLQAMTIYKHADDKAIVNIGFAGIVSAVTGFNQQGLFLSLSNAEPFSPYVRHNNSPSTSSKKLSANAFSLRNTLETSKTTQQASKALSKVIFDKGKNILAADKSQTVVFEFQANKKLKKRSWNSKTHPNKPWGKRLQIASIDCHVLDSLDDNCTESQDNYRWFRLRKLAQFNDNNPATIREVSSILLDSNNDGGEILNRNTINSLLYKPESNELYLYSASENKNGGFQVTHLPYINLLPSKVEIKKVSAINIISLSWALLSIMLLIILWSYKLPHKVLEKCKEMLN